MGYCFGGAATLELARSGKAEDVTGYASFHGGLQTPEGQSWEGVDRPLLVMHGADTSVTMDHVATLAQEPRGRGHALRDPDLLRRTARLHQVRLGPLPGACHHESWQAFADFLADQLGSTCFLPSAPAGYHPAGYDSLHIRCQLEATSLQRDRAA